MNFKGIDLTPIFAALATIVTALLANLAQKIKAKAEEDTKLSKAQRAGLRVTAIVTTLAGKAWDRLNPKVQAALADGKITPEERAAIEAEVRVLALEAVGEDQLQEIAEAIGLPFAGLIAKLASMLISMFTKAHDPDLTDTESPLAFPVSSEDTAFATQGG